MAYLKINESIFLLCAEIESCWSPSPSAYGKARKGEHGAASEECAGEKANSVPAGARKRAKIGGREAVTCRFPIDNLFMFLIFMVSLFYCLDVSCLTGSLVSTLSNTSLMLICTSYFRVVVESVYIE